MMIFIMRRLVLLLGTLFLLTLICFCLNYYTSGASLGGSALVEAYRYYFWSLIHSKFGGSSINGLSIGMQLADVFPATMELFLLAFLLARWSAFPSALSPVWRVVNGMISVSAFSPCSVCRCCYSGWRCY